MGVQTNTWKIPNKHLGKKYSFSRGTQKIMFKKLHVKTTQHNTTTRSKKQDKSIEGETRKIQRTEPGMGAPLHETEVKQA